MENIFVLRPRDVVYRFGSGHVVLDLYTEPKTDTLTVFLQDKKEPNKYRIRKFEINERFFERSEKIDGCIDMTDFSSSYPDKSFDENGKNENIKAIRDICKKIGANRKMFGTVGVAYVNNADANDDEIIKDIGIAYASIQDILKKMRN
jgi:hypothetical protein